MISTLERLPPHDIEAEQSVLGSFLLDRETIIHLATSLRSEDFYQPSHALIYQAVYDLYDRHEPADLTTLPAELNRRGQIDQVGGLAYLINLVEAVPTAAHAAHYAEIIRRTATLRRLINAGAAIVGIGYQQKIEADAAIDQAERALYEVSQSQATREFEPLNDVMNRYFDELGRLQQLRGALTGVPTGFSQLDEVTGGLQRSDLIIVAARPSGGKTSFGLGLAHAAAMQAGRTVGIFSLEMSGEQLVQRLISSQTGVDSRKLRSGHLSDTDWSRVTNAFGQLSRAKLYIDDNAGLSVIDIRTRARRLKAEHGLDLLLIDYLQLMQGGKRTDNRVQEISEISRGLKLLARELNIPVVALSQMSRAVEGRADHRPMLSDLRESGSIEQDADIVMFLHNEHRYMSDKERQPEKEHVVDLIIAKHRNGPLRKISLYFFDQSARFSELPATSDGTL